MKRIKSVLIAGCILLTGCSFSDEEITEGTNNAEGAVDIDGIPQAYNSTEEKYEAFINGELSVKIEDFYQQNTDYSLEEIFNEESYTIDEIDELLKDNIRSYDASVETDIEDTIIDCGADGENELLVRFNMNGAKQNGYYVLFVIKDINDELQLKYFCAGDEENNIVSINDTGYVSESGSAGASQYNSSFGYLDSEVTWQPYYGEYYFLDMMSFGDYLNREGYDVDFSGEEWSELQAEVYFVENGDTTNIYYVYTKVDEAGNVDESIYESTSIYKQFFDELGVETYSTSDIELVLAQQRESIGLKEEIIDDYYSHDEEIDAAIKEYVELDDSKRIEYCEWLDEEHSVYRISVGRTEEIEDEYSHLEDYFFARTSDDVKYFKVDYPSKNDPIDSDRYVCDACDFTAYFEDITFDGENDIVISLGHQGASGTEVHCAYVYVDGEYVYTKSFEEIPNYQIDNDNKCIVGEYDGEEYKYIFQNGEFVQQ